jgi:hypothetical protein
LIGSKSVQIAWNAGHPISIAGSPEARASSSPIAISTAAASQNTPRQPSKGST